MGQQILDVVLVANEIVDKLKRKKGKGMVFRLDFEKAYDSVSQEVFKLGVGEEEF